jgi:N6-adenosine-specific RNA methylase IME4
MVQKNLDRIRPGLFNIALVDPPWRYMSYAMHRDPVTGEKWGHRQGEAPYPVMTLEAICALPVARIMAPDSVLFMWVTDPFLELGFEVIRAWGFRYSTVGFYWIKRNPSGLGLMIGQGHHTRSNPEQCLLAIRGRGLRRVDKAVRKLIESPVEEHSRKPAETRVRIERLYGEVPRIELFATERWPGWAAWGNSVISDISLE